MQKYFIYLLVLFFFGSCSTKRPSHISRIIEVNSDAQYYNDGKVEYIGNRVKIVSKGDLKTYICLRRTFHTIDEYDKKTNEVHSTVTKVDTSFIYFVIKKDAKLGLVYNKKRGDSLNAEVFHIDTLLASVGLDSLNLRPAGIDLGKPIEVVKNSTVILEKYCPKKMTADDPDSIYRYYDTRLKDVDFTFSRILDHKYKSKLVRIRSIYNPVQKEVNGKKVHVPRMEVNWEMADATHPKNLLESYFELFKVDSPKFDLVSH